MWRLVVGGVGGLVFGGWRAVVADLSYVVGGWQLLMGVWRCECCVWYSVVGGGRLACGGWWLVVGGRWSAVGCAVVALFDGCRLRVGVGGLRVVVGGVPWMRVCDDRCTLIGDR